MENPMVSLGKTTGLFETNSSNSVPLVPPTRFGGLFITVPGSHSGHGLFGATAPARVQLNLLRLHSNRSRRPWEALVFGQLQLTLSLDASDQMQIIPYHIAGVNKNGWVSSAATSSQRNNHPVGI